MKERRGHMFENSNSLLDKVVESIPLAAQTYSKSYRYFVKGESPLFMERGNGAYVYDVDGNKFTDYICALGPITVGYNNKVINDAIVEQLNKGIIFSQPSPIAFELAEKIKSFVPGSEMVRFMKNGSDVTTAAIRLARAHTGREHIVVCGYHGIHDWYIGSTENNAGIPKGVCDLTHTFNYNDLDSLNLLIRDYPEQIAAIIIEPIQDNGPADGFLEGLRQLADKNGIVLIYDEVVSGFRYANGGAVELYGIIPDVVAMGKGMANGMPLSAIAGKKYLLELIETQKVFISTTFGGECLSIAASLAVLDMYEKNDITKHMWRLGQKMLDGFKGYIDEYKLSEYVRCYGLAPHSGVVFEDSLKANYLQLQTLYQKIMIQHGILTTGVNNISFAHSEEDIDILVDAFGEAMKKIRSVVSGDTDIDSLIKTTINPVFKRNNESKGEVK